MSSIAVKHFSKGRYVLHSPIRTTKLHPEAEIPHKENETDVGWDLTVVSRCDSRAEDTYQDVNMFTTGLVVRPPDHYHLEIIPHPSLVKAGYMMASNPLIINPDDDGELILSLYKYKECDDLELPYRAALLILRPTEYAVVSSEGGSKKQSSRQVTSEEEVEFVQAPPKKSAARGKQAKANHLF